MVPLWSRARPISNVWVFCFLDFLFILLWLIAWTSTAGYVIAGKRAEKVKGAGRTCDNFGYGAASKCKLSEATTILAVIEMVLFIATMCISTMKLPHHVGEERGLLPPPPSRDNDLAPQTLTHTRQTSQSKLDTIEEV